MAPNSCALHLIFEMQGIVFNVVGGSDMTLQEINAAAEVIYENVDPDANIIFGALVDDKITNGEVGTFSLQLSNPLTHVGVVAQVSITVLATGFGTDFYSNELAREEAPAPQKQASPSSSGRVSSAVDPFALAAPSVSTRAPPTQGGAGRPVRQALPTSLPRQGAGSTSSGPRNAPRIQQQPVYDDDEDIFEDESRYSSDARKGYTASRQTSNSRYQPPSKNTPTSTSGGPFGIVKGIFRRLKRVFE